MQSLQNGLVGHWKLDGHAKDNTPHSNHGTIFGATPSFDRHGKPNGAMSFDGVDDRISISSNFLPLEIDELTVGTWVYVREFNSDTTNRGTHFVSDFNSWSVGSQKGWQLICWYSSTFDRLSWGFWICDGVDYHVLNYDTLDFSVFQEKYANQWIYVCGVFRKNNYKKLYLNGDEVASSNSNVSSPIISEVATPIYFGYGGINPAYLNGLIDDVRIYNRALSAEEIKLLYHSYDPKLKFS